MFPGEGEHPGPGGDAGAGTTGAQSPQETSVHGERGQKASVRDERGQKAGAAVAQADRVTTSTVATHPDRITTNTVATTTVSAVAVVVIVIAADLAPVTLLAAVPAVRGRVPPGLGAGPAVRTAVPSGPATVRAVRGATTRVCHTPPLLVHQ
ncbi:hypothetical protein ACFVIM_10160 [Streptomyces sp. NPDC057638]|uniref:hypothetical protein n=1 Tax=Streptomyces sp. NPDC057638 TaxID=3346190 RepID=UPI0036A41587